MNTIKTDQKLKHRIIGLSVIVALLVLITPFLYKNNDRLIAEMEHSSFSSKTTTNDKYEEKTINTPDRYATSENSSIRQNNGLKESTLQLPHSRVLDDGRSTTWIIQLASFTNDNNATKLVETLRKQGYNAYTQSAVNTNDLAVTRVLVGPQTRRTYAEDLVLQLANEFGLEGMIVKNNPVGN